MNFAVLYILAAHLCGDFLLQNHWMQAKSKDSLVCLCHVAIYAFVMVVPCALAGIPMWGLYLIVTEHFLQDCFALHLRWIRFYRQTTPDLWPVGPLCMDQSMHLVFVALVCAFSR